MAKARHSEGAQKGVRFSGDDLERIEAYRQREAATRGESPSFSAAVRELVRRGCAQSTEGR